MIFSAPLPFDQAINSVQVRTLLPSDMDSAGWRKLLSELPEDIRQRVAFSSEVERYDILKTFFAGVGKVVNRQLGDQDPRTFIRNQLKDLRYAPEAGQEGTIKDLYSTQRLKVMTDTNLDLALGFGQFAQAQRNVDDYPAWELFRAEDREKPRGDPDYKGDAAIGWGDRFAEAAEQSGDAEALACYNSTGRMVALKDSGVWDYLGETWEDSLGNPYPPFAWGSGMDVQEIDRTEAEALGLIDPDETVTPREIPDLNASLQKPIADRDEELFAALQAALGPEYEIRDGVLREVGGE